jgi:hypothetical protein
MGPQRAQLILWNSSRPGPSTRPLTMPNQIAVRSSGQAEPVITGGMALRIVGPGAEGGFGIPPATPCSRISGPGFQASTQPSTCVDPTIPGSLTAEASVKDRSRCWAKSSVGPGNPDGAIQGSNPVLCCRSSQSEIATERFLLAQFARRRSDFQRTYSVQIVTAPWGR